MAGITNEYSNVLLEYFNGGSVTYNSNHMFAGLLLQSGSIQTFNSSSSSGVGVSGGVGAESFEELPSGNGYSQIELSFNSASNGSIVSTGQVTFGPATDDWGEIRGVGIYTATGTLAWFSHFNTPVTIISGDTLSVGPFTLALD